MNRINLSFSQIKSITTGAVRVEQENGKCRFFRFTQEQETIYKKASIEQNRSFYDRCAATAGVRLMFKTNSQTLKLAVEVLKRTSRTYFSFDIFVNGKAVAYLDNFSETQMPQYYTEVDLPLGKFSKEVSLEAGEKEICIYFPWSVCPVLEELSLDDGATLMPVKPNKKLLAFGDSITQGYDALRSSSRYAARLADKLGAEEINKGIGGEVFFPQLAKTKEDFVPEYITVAYGTNDFSLREEDDFKQRCKEFFVALSSNYPDSRIFAITPIWRRDYEGPRKFGPFENVEADIAEIIADLPNVTLISGFDLVPKNETFFADMRLHPTDAGFAHYADNLYDKIHTKI